MDTLEQPNAEAENSAAAAPIANRQPALSERKPAIDIQKISACLFWIKCFFDYLAGAIDEPPPGAAFLSSSIWIGVWWGLMIGLILLFCGQTSKFIYIDF